MADIQVSTPTDPAILESLAEIQVDVAQPAAEVAADANWQVSQADMQRLEQLAMDGIRAGRGLDNC